MQRKHSTATLLTAVLGLTVCNTSIAEAITHWYFGANFSKTKYEIADVNESLTFSNATLTTIASTEDENDKSWKIFTGYQLSRYLAIEAAYVNLGNYKQSGTRNITDLIVFESSAEDSPSTVIDIPGTIEATLKPKGIEVTGVAISPTLYGISVRARAGLLFSDYAARITITENVPSFDVGASSFPAFTQVSTQSIKSTEIEMIAGLGVDYRANKDWSLGFHWDRYFDFGNNNTGEGDIDVVGIDISYHY